MIYLYWVSRGLASLHVVNRNGADIDRRFKKIGQFKTDTQAKEACLKHYEKACRAAENFGRKKPDIGWF